MTNSNKICGLLGLATRAGKIVFGTEACKMAIRKRKLKLVLIAEDASDRTKLNFKQICTNANIPLAEILPIEELSKAIGKTYKAIVGIVDVNFSNAILKIINGGEVIG